MAYFSTDKVKANADLSAAIKLKPNADLYFTRANFYSTDNPTERDKAIADLSEAIKLNPNFVEAYKKRGPIYADKGQSDLAIADASQVVKLQPNEYMSYIQRSMVYCDPKANKKDLAVADLKKAEEIMLKDPKLQTKQIVLTGAKIRCGIQ